MVMTFRGLTSNDIGASMSAAPGLNATCDLIARYADILVHLRNQEKLEQRTPDAEADDLPEFRGFATGLRKDWDAVMAGLSLHWNSGPPKCTSSGSRC